MLRPSAPEQSGQRKLTWLQKCHRPQQNAQTAALLPQDTDDSAAAAAAVLSAAAAGQELQRARLTACSLSKWQPLTSTLRNATGGDDAPADSAAAETGADSPSGAGSQADGGASSKRSSTWLDAFRWPASVGVADNASEPGYTHHMPADVQAAHQALSVATLCRAVRVGSHCRRAVWRQNAGAWCDV